MLNTDCFCNSICCETDKTVTEADTFFIQGNENAVL